MSALDNLKSAMATSATGYAAVIDGVVDIRTVTATANGAALNALATKGISVLTNCTDPACDCTVKVLGEAFPEMKIVGVKVEVVANG